MSVLREILKGNSFNGPKFQNLPSSVINHEFPIYPEPPSVLFPLFNRPLVQEPPRNHQATYESFLSPRPAFHSVVILAAFETCVCEAGEARSSAVVSSPLSSGSLYTSGQRRCVHVLGVQLACSLGRRWRSVVRINCSVAKIYLSTTEKKNRSLYPYLEECSVRDRLGKTRSRVHFLFVGVCLFGDMSCMKLGEYLSSYLIHHVYLFPSI